MTASLFLLGCDRAKIREAVESFSGVWRRFDFAGRNENGTAVYDDYAHNVEKIASCMKSARELCPGRVLFVFQPHGYGPLGFMRKELYPALEEAMGRRIFSVFFRSTTRGGHLVPAEGGGGGG